MFPSAAGFNCRRSRIFYFPLFACLLVVSGLLQPALAENESALADINKDGVTDVLDIVILNSHAAKKSDLAEDKKILAKPNQKPHQPNPSHL
jgi:hypothetical protein